MINKSTENYCLKTENYNMLKQELSLKQKQKLSPIQFQSIKMLGYSTLEMEEVINKELEINPALEEGDDPVNKNEAENENYPEDDDFPIEIESANDSGLADDLDIMENDSFSEEKYNYKAVSNYSGDDYNKSFLPQEESFYENLTAQLEGIDADDFIIKLAKYIIGNINESGYLTRSIENLADDLAFSMGIDATQDDLMKALEIVKSLEPAGIGARNLKECLSLQINRKPPTKSVLNARKIIDKYFEKFTLKKYSSLKTKLALDDNQLKDAIDEILKLNPKPGNDLNGKAETWSSRIIPDFIVEQYNDNLYVSLNNYNYPNLIVNQSYMQMLKDFSLNKPKSRKDREAFEFTKQKVDSAHFFIEAIKQRNLTLIRTMIAIAKKQQNFFLSGIPDAIVPLKLKDIADVINYNISTISRVTNGKYVQTQYGIFPLKYFFSASLKTDVGEDVSAKKIKYLIQTMILEENKSAPHNDLEITKMLNEKGYQISRRTVSKYREQLKIPNTNHRIKHNL